MKKNITYSFKYLFVEGCIDTLLTKCKGHTKRILAQGLDSTNHLYSEVCTEKSKGQYSPSMTEKILTDRCKPSLLSLFIKPLKDLIACGIIQDITRSNT